MQKIKTHRIKVAITMVAVMLLVACSSGDDAPQATPTPTEPTEPTTPATELEIPIVVAMSAASYEDWTTNRASRRDDDPEPSWQPPTGYSLYSALYGASYVNLPDHGHSTIDLLMAHDGEGDGGGVLTTTPNPLHARLSYSSATDKWKLGLPHGVKEDAVKSGYYYAYGFVPRDAADNAELEHLDGSSKWANGAKLKIYGLKAVASDPCIIIGAKEGPNKYEDNGLKAGDFKFHLDTGTKKIDNKDVINPNYLYFLFDHLYSALSISMRVNGTYHALRHISLKELKLRTQTSEGTPYKSDVTITLSANNTGTNPIGESVAGVISYDKYTYSDTESTIYSNSTGFDLGTDYSMFLGHFLPQGVTSLILTSVYDVYDTHGNLIRQNCSATNALVLSKLFNGQTESLRGWEYTVNLTIKPTYLYVMSDPDLNNPTVTVE
jgi:hypothetical protein